MRNLLLLAVLTAAMSSGAQARSEHEVCYEISTMAKGIMALRQAGKTAADVHTITLSSMQTSGMGGSNAVRELFEMLIGDAFEVPVMSNGRAKSDAEQAFADRTYISCINN